VRAREGKLAGKLGVTGAAVALQRGKIWQAGPTGQRMGARERAEASAPRLGLNGERVGPVARKRSEAGACAGGAGPCREWAARTGPERREASWAAGEERLGRALKERGSGHGKEKWAAGLGCWVGFLGFGFGFLFLFLSSFLFQTPLKSI